MSTMSDVLPSSNQEALPTGPNVPKSQAAIERLRKRMEGYRDLQTHRLPDYEQTMNHVNSQQMQDTVVLRQKYHESKAKKPNKKSSSASNAASAGDKMKHDHGPAGPGPMNGMMGFHGGPHNGPHMGPGPNMNGPPMGMNGPVSHNGPLGGHQQNGPNNMMGSHQNGPNNGVTHNKRPLDDDSSNIQSDTAKRLNLDNGNISDQNFIKREPSPHETKFNPGFGGHGGQPQPPQAQTGGQQPQPSPGPDVKPNVASLKMESGQDSGQTKSAENSDIVKDELKSEVSDSVKQEDTLNDLDLNLDFTGLGEDINGEVLDDLIGDMGEFDTFDFDNSKIDEKDNVNLSAPSENGGQQNSSTPATGTSSSSTVSGNNGVTPAAETLKMMAQQHQHPPQSQGGQPGQPPYPQGDQPPGPHNGPMTTPNTSLPSNNFQPPHSAMPSQGTPMSSAPNPMQQGPPMTSMDSTANSQNMQHPMQHQRPAEGDPRLRAAVQQRFRLGNPNSIANSMSGGMPGVQSPGMNSHPGMMNSHQRMPMGNNMMNNMPGNQQGGMGPNMQMMNQQQVSFIVVTRIMSLLIIKIFADARNGSNDPSANDADATTANEDAAAPGHDEAGGGDA